MKSNVLNRIDLFFWRIRASRFSSKTLIENEGWRLIIRNHWSHWFNGFPFFTLSFEKGTGNGSATTLNAGFFGFVFVLFIYSKSSNCRAGKKDWKQI
ncbi:hypothetical protein DLM78_22360 [Leptospira stimsonii]|uniref:Uncharacterized protein n=1 Tax=Leptospira stimsonii TaxID=2202203 RepID=A0A8B3CJJ0_9LEPT|nr:hypothetical protein DLM78_22360 [Leptospira stimsonii]